MTIRGAETPEAVLFDESAREYDAVLVMSFGGPEGPQDVAPFLRNVLRGRESPRGASRRSPSTIGGSEG